MVLNLIIAEKENEAVCKWNVDTLDHLLETAKSFKPTWDIPLKSIAQKFQGTEFDKEAKMVLSQDKIYPSRGKIETTAPQSKSISSLAFAESASP